MQMLPQRQGSVTGESKPNAHHVTRVSIATATISATTTTHIYVRQAAAAAAAACMMTWCGWWCNSTRSVIQGKRSSSAGLELSLGCEGGEGEGCGFEFFSSFFVHRAQSWKRVVLLYCGTENQL